MACSSAESCGSKSSGAVRAVSGCTDEHGRSSRVRFLDQDGDDCCSGDDRLQQRGETVQRRAQPRAQSPVPRPLGPRPCGCVLGPGIWSPSPNRTTLVGPSWSASSSARSAAAGSSENTTLANMLSACTRRNGRSACRASSTALTACARNRPVAARVLGEQRASCRRTRVRGGSRSRARTSGPPLRRSARARRGDIMLAERVDDEDHVGRGQRTAVARALFEGSLSERLGGHDVTPQVQLVGRLAREDRSSEIPGCLGSVLEQPVRLSDQPGGRPCRRVRGPCGGPRCGRRGRRRPVRRSRAPTSAPRGSCRRRGRRSDARRRRSGQ